MDGLPVKEETGYEFSSQHEGYMHACGHDLHMAIALGILTYFAEHRIDDDLLFIFQPAEEGPGGAEPMLKSAVFKAWQPDQIYALHIAPEYPVGSVATKVGALFASAGELEIEVIGQGGHAARPHQANDALLAAAHLVTQLANIVTKNIDPLHPAIINVGTFVSGTRGNIVADYARITGTVRAFSQETVAIIKARVESLATSIEKVFGCKVIVNWGNFYAPVINEPRLTQEFMQWVEHKSGCQLIECSETLCGEDFGFFLEQMPGMMFWLGVDCQFPLHHAELKPDESAIGIGIDLMVNFIAG